jgi:dUTP pyrophosphatase
VKLSIRRLHPRAVIPHFASTQAACFDLTATERSPIMGRSRIYSTGLAFSIPQGYYLELAIRSGLAFNDDFILANGVGIVDADFRGEVKIKLTYLCDGQPDWPWPGDRIAQGRLVRLVKTQIEEVEELDKTERGDGGFGSTGRWIRIDGTVDSDRRDGGFGSTGR